MKRKLLQLALLSLAIGCSSKELNEQEPIEEVSVADPVVGEPAARETEVSKSFYGYYINSKYLESLKKTKSAKESQSVSDLSMIEITSEEGNGVLRATWNFHEGDDSDPIVMKSKNEGTVISRFFKEKKFDLQVRPNGRIILSKGDVTYEMVRFEPRSLGFGFDEASSVVNQILFEGEYHFGSRTVNLGRDGQVVGIDSVTNYYINTDYFDAGMSFDKVYLTIKGKKKEGAGDEYGFEIRKDTLEIFRLNCLLFNPNDPEFCEDHSRGEPAYILVKK